MSFDKEQLIEEMRKNRPDREAFSRAQLQALKDFNKISREKAQRRAISNTQNDVMYTL